MLFSTITALSMAAVTGLVLLLRRKNPHARAFLAAITALALLALGLWMHRNALGFAVFTAQPADSVENAYYNLAFATETLRFSAGFACLALATALVQRLASGFGVRLLPWAFWAGFLGLATSLFFVTYLFETAVSSDATLSANPIMLQTLIISSNLLIAFAFVAFALLTVILLGRAIKRRRF